MTEPLPGEAASASGGAQQPRRWLAPTLIVIGFIPALIIGWALIDNSGPVQPIGFPELNVGGEVVEYGAIDDRTLHLHVLGGAAGEARPTAVFVHGAREHPGTYETQARAVVDAGGVAVLVEYSSFAEDADTARQHEDVAAALTLLDAEAARFGVDVDRLTVVAAASGSRASTYGWTEGLGTPLPSAFVFLSATHEASSWPELASGPPVTMLHGTSDALIPLRRARNLCDAMPDCTLEVFEGGDHRFYASGALRLDATEIIVDTVVGR